MFFASQGVWRGYFLIVPEVLFNPRDTEKPYSLIFDLNSWQEIEPTPAPRFRGFRYLHPNLPEESGGHLTPTPSGTRPSGPGTLTTD